MPRPTTPYLAASALITLLLSPSAIWSSQSTNLVAAGVALEELENCGSYEFPLLRSGNSRDVSFTMESEQRVAIEIGDGSGGCPGYGHLVVLDADDVLVAEDDYSAREGCARILTVLPAGDYTLRFSSTDDDLPSYVVSFLTQACSVCGNRIIEAEECDDGNTSAGDGCDPGCDRRVQPLNDCGLYPTSGTFGEDDAEFTFTLSKQASVRLETGDGLGDCDADTTLHIDDQLDRDTDYDSGVRYCSRLIVSLPAGTYAVSVDNYDGVGLPYFVLEYFTGDCSTCGNGIVEAEECDDGNLIAGDGCNSECAREIPILAQCGGYSLGTVLAGDAAEFKLTLDADTRVRLETGDGAGGCSGWNYLVVRDEDDNFVVLDGRSGVGFCSRFLGPLSTGRYSVRIESMQDTTGLELEYYSEDCTVCGNGFIEAEDCDDGDTLSGDGCTASCLNEIPVLECGAYDRPAVLGGDEDVFTFTLRNPSTIRTGVATGGGCVDFTSLHIADHTNWFVVSEFGSGTCPKFHGTLPTGTYCLRKVEMSGSAPCRNVRSGWAS